MSRLLTYAAAALLWAMPLSAQDAPASGLAFYQAGAIKEHRSGRLDIGLRISQAVPWRVFTLDNPYRLVVDFREVNWQGVDATALDTVETITGLRFGPFAQGWSRMVADLNQPMAIDQAWLDVAPTQDSAQVTLRLRPTTAMDFAARSGVPSGPGWQPPDTKVQTVQAPSKDGRITVVLDAGHGGIDPGAQGAGLREADLMLQFARELREVLLRAGGYNVILTRSADRFVSLEARVKAAHDARADVFISLHADALNQGQARGASVYVLADDATDAATAALVERHDRGDILAGAELAGSDDKVAAILLDLARLENTPRSKALARQVVSGIENSVGYVHKNPLRHAGFSVLKAADIPSILIELGFLSSASDNEDLQDPIWRAAMAAGIRDGIADWALEDKALAGLRRQ